MPIHPSNVRSLAQMEDVARRRLQVNLALSFVVLWCLVMWLAVLILLGVTH
jgi:hypothetical protein